MSTETELKTITATEAKALRMWPLTTPYRLINEYYAILAEMERLQSDGINVALVQAKQPGTAEIWRDGTEYTAVRPYESDAQLCRERMGWL